MESTESRYCTEIISIEPSSNSCVTTKSTDSPRWATILIASSGNSIDAPIESIGSAVALSMQMVGSILRLGEALGTEVVGTGVGSELGSAVGSPVGKSVRGAQRGSQDTSK